MSTLRVNTLQDATGSNQPAMVGAAKAWVNFTGAGTPSIRAAFNVSSITDYAVGGYLVNFTNAMPDSNYGATALGGDINNGGSFDNTSVTTSDQQTGYIHLICRNIQASAAVSDAQFVSVAVFR